MKITFFIVFFLQIVCLSIIVSFFAKCKPNYIADLREGLIIISLSASMDSTE